MTDPQYTPAYVCERNPHNHLTKVCHPKGHCGDYEYHTPVWRCVPCGMEGALDELNAVSCTHIYPACDGCGLTPICAWDCPGIAKVLSSPGVYLAGFGEEQ